MLSFSGKPYKDTLDPDYAQQTFTVSANQKTPTLPPPKEITVAKTQGTLVFLGPFDVQNWSHQPQPMWQDLRQTWIPALSFISYVTLGNASTLSDCQKPLSKLKNQTKDTNHKERIQS